MKTANLINCLGGVKWKTVLTASLFHIELQQFFPFNPDITSKHPFLDLYLEIFFHLEQLDIVE